MGRMIQLFKLWDDNLIMESMDYWWNRCPNYGMHDLIMGRMPYLWDGSLIMGQMT